MHPSVSKFAVRGIGNGNMESILPSEPTSIPPGPGKVDVMKRRVERGESCFHPLDAWHSESTLHSNNRMLVERLEEDDEYRRS